MSLAPIIDVISREICELVDALDADVDPGDLSAVATLLELYALELRGIARLMRSDDQRASS